LAELTLIFNRYTRLAEALFSPLRFKVFIMIENLPKHMWSISTTQEVLGSSTLIFNTTLASTVASNLLQFLVATWAKHSDLIPNEVGCIVLEPV
jgi:hypothetical protein